MSEMEKKIRVLEFSNSVQREIINLQRLYILDLKKTLPLSDETRWGMMLEHAMKRLEEIHKPKKIKETSCKSA
ncbi:MAG: hypothetical protein OM95_07060 [Bdellovibrio sp. ArHS]|uniref:hypothetical protein n=1 Tax=Bdellovibrio sp. ArHS TaxID=1569284 RepID=UPI0005835D30|nr:hypothetical protein [Bdellovibrio sp. ArHS]KHD88868.1 MAG: hypothetical protein OM95_07060 [Bdellovibrio sp. ArHS]